MKFICLTDSQTTASNNGVYTLSNTGYYYTFYNIYRGLTLIKDVPVFIDLQNRTSAAYNSENIVSISAGIDGSLWGLLYE
jgi:hypothetical protein